METNVASDINRTLSFYKAGGAPSIGMLSPDIQKDLQISTGSAGTPGGTGLQAYNLLPTALTLYPVLTPLRNLTPRLQGRGRQSEFKAVLGVTGATTQNVWGAEGASGQKVNLVIEDIVALYRSIKIATGVSFEQQWAGQGFVDSKSLAVVNLLRQFMVQEELAILFGANSTAAKNQFAGGAVGTPTTMTGGGAYTLGGGATFAANTVYTVAAGGGLANSATTVQVTGVTGMGESIASATVSVTPAASGQIILSPPARAQFPVQYWNFYVAVGGTTYLIRSNGEALIVSSLTSATGVGHLAGTTAATGTNSTTNTVGTAFQATVFSGSIPAADNSASSSAYNGLLTQIYGSTAAQDGTYTWAGVGMPNFGNQKPGATVISAQNTLAMTGASSNSLENFLGTLWNNAFADPAWLLAYQQEARAITRGTLGAGTPYFVVVPEGNQNDATANFRVSRFTNPITGSELQIKVHPYLTQGTIIAGSDQLPSWYVPTEIPAPFALDMLQDYIEIDYPPVYNTSSGGDTWVIQVMNMGTFKLFVPNVFGALDSVVSS